ncbi:PREDICTED: uncharacterized protein LOC101309559 [Fragaria vesca subsp. vesca]
MWQKGHQHHRFERGRAQPCFFLNIAVTRASFTTGYISLAFLSFVLYTQFVRTVLCMMAWKKIKIMENHAQGKSQVSYWLRISNAYRYIDFALFARLPMSIYHI